MSKIFVGVGYRTRTLSLMRIGSERSLACSLHPDLVRKREKASSQQFLRVLPAVLDASQQLPLHDLEMIGPGYSIRADFGKPDRHPVLVVSQIDPASL